MLKVKLKKWGSSQGIIIPKKVREANGIPDFATFTLKVDHNQLILTTINDKRNANC